MYTERPNNGKMKQTDTAKRAAGIAAVCGGVAGSVLAGGIILPVFAAASAGSFAIYGIRKYEKKNMADGSVVDEEIDDELRLATNVATNGLLFNDIPTKKKYEYLKRKKLEMQENPHEARSNSFNWSGNEMLDMATVVGGAVGVLWHKKTYVASHKGHEWLSRDDAQTMEDFNNEMNTGVHNKKSYTQIRKLMNKVGLTGDKFDVGHGPVPNDTANGYSGDEDKGWNLFAQPKGDNIRLGHKPVDPKEALHYGRRFTPDVE